MRKFFTIQRGILFIVATLVAGINALILRNIHWYYTREIAASLYLLVFPGFLLSWMIYPKLKNIWEWFCSCLGLSLVLLMLVGLVGNWLLPLKGITHPLAELPVLTELNSVVGLFLTYLFIRNKPLPFDKIKVRFSLLTILFCVVPLLFPVLSVLGAISLNDNHTNILTMSMLGLIAGYVLILTFVRNKISEHVFIFTALMIGLSLLLMTSLRGWYITGHDMYLEYYVFQLTKLHDIWKMSNFQNPYTACISITILPTMIAAITHIPDMYIYKILYQIIFSFSLVVSYLFLRKSITPFLSFLGTFIIASLPTFMTDMPMLNRQEIALFFFALLLNTLFTKDLSTIRKWLLFSLFGLGLTLSHYSTTYVTLSLFLGTSLAYLAINTVKRHPSLHTIIHAIDKKFGIEHNKTNINIVMSIVLLLVTICWNFSITHTSDGIIQTMTSIQDAITHKQFSKGKSDPASYSLINTKKPTQQNLLTMYIQTETAYTRKFNDDSAFLKKAIYSQYPVTSNSQAIVPLTALGEKMNSFHINAFKLNDTLKQIYAKIMQVLIILGLLVIFWYKKYLHAIKKEQLLLTLVFFGFLIVQTVLPGSSIDYGILRLFQQGLILLVIPLLIGALSLLSIFDKIHESIKIYLTSLIFIFFFLFLSGFIPQITGGYYTPLNLANSGFYYEAYYTHTEELSSINWLAQHRDKKLPIQADWFTGKKIHTYGNFYSIDGILPSTIRRNSYVYLSYSNIQTDKVMVYVNGAPIYYTFPIPLLDQNKNLIYNNGGTRIYR